MYCWPDTVYLYAQVREILHRDWRLDSGAPVLFHERFDQLRQLAHESADPYWYALYMHYFM